MTYHLITAAMDTAERVAFDAELLEGPDERERRQQAAVLAMMGMGAN